MRCGSSEVLSVKRVKSHHNEMLIQRTVCSVCIILVIDVIRSSRGHDDCNHKRVVDQFFYMCSAYSPYSSTKREANAAEGFAPNNVAPGPGPMFPVQNDIGALGNWQQRQQQQVPRAPRVPAQQQPSSPTFQSASYYPWQITPYSPSNVAAEQQQDVQDHRIRRKEMQLPAALPNEPEDFASFNNWYLNPVYADADWQSAIERWRRRSHINDEIWKFVKSKCCVNGCRFPNDYWELDKRVNICGMR